ncbi:MAG: hypothetical protein ACK452_08835 [Bacteroidota bacterium]|jgi:hypothetical protein
MRDVFWTIMITWIVWRIWAWFSTSKNVIIQKNEHHHHYNRTKEGDTKIVNSSSTSKKYFNDGDGEYVEFEEIKK